MVPHAIRNFRLTSEVVITRLHDSKVLCCLLSGKMNPLKPTINLLKPNIMSQSLWTITFWNFGQQAIFSLYD